MDSPTTTTRSSTTTRADPTGTIAVPDNVGVAIVGYGSPDWQSAGNIIQGNLISGNLSNGIVIADTNQTQVLDNLLGTDRTGTAALGNGGNGVGLGNAGAPSIRSKVTPSRSTPGTAFRMLPTIATAWPIPQAGTERNAFLQTRSS